MTYKYIGSGRYIAGLPIGEDGPRDLTDEEFAAVEAKYDAEFGVKGSLSTCQHQGAVDGAGKPVPLDNGHACLLYEHVDDKPAPKPAGRVESEG